MTDSNLTIQKLLEAEPLRKSVLRSAIHALNLPACSHGLDVGCGIGLQAMLLAEAVGSVGHITGVDFDPEIIAYGKNLVAATDCSTQITLREGDMNSLPFRDNTFDWGWSADCVGYPIGDLSTPLKELFRVVRPGGTVAILAWSSQQVLPGYPILEAGLNAGFSSYAPFLKGKDPRLHFQRAREGFQAVGLEDGKAHTFVGDVQAPLTSDVRTALMSLFEMLWSEPRLEDASSDVWQEYVRLCSPGSPGFILDEPGYYAFFTYTMFQGKVPG